MGSPEGATIPKLRWLLGKATAALGETRLVELSPKDVYAWRLTIPEGHRFEATQALRTARSPGACSIPTQPSKALRTHRAALRASNKMGC